jgi:hypothetical protein
MVNNQLNKHIMEALLKINGFVPLVSSGFLPTSNTLFDNFLYPEI